MLFEFLGIAPSNTQNKKSQGQQSVRMVAYNSYSITIKGNTVTLKVGGASSSAKYTYEDGKLTMKDTATTTISLDINYKDDTLFWNVGGGIVVELTKDGVSSGKTAKKEEPTQDKPLKDTTNSAVFLYANINILATLQNSRRNIFFAVLRKSIFNMFICCKKHNMSA